MMSLFKDGYMLLIIQYDFFSIFYEKVQKLFWLQVTHNRVWNLVWINACMVLINNKSCPVMSLRLFLNNKWNYGMFYYICDGLNYSLFWNILIRDHIIWYMYPPPFLFLFISFSPFFLSLSIAKYWFIFCKKNTY